eukprot:3497359-Alexandrium_andersonii.AAC.1
MRGAQGAGHTQGSVSLPNLARGIFRSYQVVISSCRHLQAVFRCYPQSAWSCLKQAHREAQPTTCGQ